MPHKDKEEGRAYQKEYRKKNKEKNKEAIAKREKEYREKNKEAIAKKHKEYYEENKEKIAEYRQTLACKKTKRISKWKFKGLICEDIDALYEKFLNTKKCENCEVELTVDRYNTTTTRAMDHDHTTGLFRNVLCHPCNVKRG